MKRNFYTLLLALLCFTAIAATPPAPPANPTNPLLPPVAMVMVTNVTMVWTNVAVKTPTISFDNVTIYGGTNALKGALVIAWDRSPDATVTGYNLYYGPTTAAQTNVFATKAYVSTVLFYSVLDTNLTYWMNVTAVAATATNSTESVPSNTIIVH